MAAVYDHAVVTAALDHRHQIAFLSVEGTLPANAEARRLGVSLLKVLEQR